MNHKPILLVVLLALPLLPLLAQDCLLTKEANLLLDSDEVVYRQISYFDVGQDGEGAVWDLSDLNIEGEAYKFYLSKDTLNRNILMTNTDVYYYKLQNDTLSLVSRENPLNRLTYEEPLLQIKYPLAYGDSVTKAFEAYGIYCGDYPFKEQGISTVMADATGSIILDEDTINNIVRVYTLRSYSICMDMDSAALDTAKQKQVIEERYDWYARGYRYPIFSTISNTSYDKLAPLGTIQTAYCLLPDIQKLSYDPYNDDIRRKDSLTSVNGSNAQQDIIHYSVSLNGSQITINYSLDEIADITALVSNPMGIVYRQKRTHSDKGDGYSLTIDCGGLHYGQYVLYLNVNGRIHNEKIVLK